MKSVDITLDELYTLYNEFKNGVNKEKSKIEKEISILQAKQICEDAKRAYTQIINEWYSSFSPGIYDRKGTLQNAAKFEIVNDTQVVITMSDENLGGHRVGNEYLYNLTMRQGYHGGAMHDGVPMYRTQPPFLNPTNPWSRWSRPAEKTFSPVRAMRAWAKSYQSPNMQKKLIERIVRKYLSKYKFFRLFYM